MNEMMDIPQGRKRIRAGRVCLLLGLTILLLMLELRPGAEAGLVVQARP